MSRSVLAKAKSAPRSKFFARAQQKGRALLKQPDQLLELVKTANRRSRRFAAGPLAGKVDDLKALLRLIRAFAKGQYRDVSVESMTIIVATVLYIVSPLDLIPDALPVGLLDDVAVLGFTLRLVREELQTFLEWERSQAR